MVYEIGVQVYTYREFTIDEFCADLADTDVTAVELMDTHLAPDAGGDAVETALARLEDAGLSVRGYYGGSFDSEGLQAARERFAFAAELGADYVACDFPAALAGEMGDLAAEHDLLVGVHNHGPGARYETVADVQRAVEDAPERVGACLDTGHFLRVDQPPSEVVPALGDRIHAVHVSDYVGPETEVAPGDGGVEFPELIELLDAHTTLSTPLTIEYEADPADPTPVVERTARLLADAQR